jgi:hypothetical protein
MKRNTFSSGQTLITILFFMVVAVTIISTAIVLLVKNSQSTTQLAVGMNAYAVAEGGAENAVLRLLRDDSYTGETMTIGDGSAVITVTGGSTKTITSQGQVGNNIKRIQVVVGYTNNILTINSWTEI